MNRVLLHCDMNNYFASVEEKYNPELRKIPFAVIGDPEMRHSIVMAKNSLAKQYGVITGLSFYQARQLCPDLQYVKADFPKYLRETKLAREIYLKYTDTIVPYGMDEAWIDLTDTGATMKEAKQIADLIRIEVKYSQGLSTSVGVSDNYIFSKLGSDYKKPNATTVIDRDNYKDIVWPLPAADLLFVGKATRKILEGQNIFTIGDIARSDPLYLIKLLGKVGYNLWGFANGDDRCFNPCDDTIKSISNTITPPEDLHNNKYAGAVIYLIANSICSRLQKHRLKAHCVAIHTKDNKFNTLTRQCSIDTPTDRVNHIFNLAYDLFVAHYNWKYPLRSIGVRVTNLIKDDHEQISLLDDMDGALCIDIDTRLVDLMQKYGKLEVEKSATARDW